MDYQDFEARIIINGFVLESYSRGVAFLIEALIDGIKPVVDEKNQFEQRDISIMALQNFRAMRIVTQDKPNYFPKEYSFTSRTILIET